MARCDQGYLCEVCGREVAEMADSDLYLSYIIGRVTPRELLAHPERHIACNPAQAQFICDPRFAPVACTGAFAKENLANEFVAEQQALVTRGWQRLQELVGQHLPVSEYPLPEICERFARQR